MANLDKAQTIVDRYSHLEGGLLECLHGIQEGFGYIPAETIDLMADAFNISRAEVHGVISYYHDFKTKPRGRNLVRICQAEACQAMGSRELSKHVETKLGLDVGESNDDYTLDAVYCFGNCALSPNIEINGKLCARVGPDDFDDLLEGGRKV